MMLAEASIVVSSALLILLLETNPSESVVVATKPSYRISGSHQSTSSLCAANRLRMPSCSFDRDVDDVIDHFNLYRPKETVYAWCYERSGSKCKALKINPTLSMVIPDIYLINCDEKNYSICLNVPHEGPH